MSLRPKVWIVYNLAKLPTLTAVKYRNIARPSLLVRKAYLFSLINDKVLNAFLGQSIYLDNHLKF